MSFMVCAGRCSEEEFLDMQPNIYKTVIKLFVSTLDDDVILLCVKLSKVLSNVQPQIVHYTLNIVLSENKCFECFELRHY